jgi:hypothetical protein
MAYKFNPLTGNFDQVNPPAFTSNISDIQTGTISITVPAIPSLEYADVGNKAIAGLVDGDHVTLMPPNAAYEDGMMFSCYVSAPDTLTINVFNGSAGPFAGTTANWRYVVIKA